MTEKRPSVLISGAGVAGTTLAHLLHLVGYRVTLVELAVGTRSSGNPVDVRGPAAEVARSLGVLPALQAAATRVSRFAFVDAAGKLLAERAEISNTSGHDIEIPRGDLARILLGALPKDVELIFGHRATALHQDADSVTVTLSNNTVGTYDLVVGADGLHSGVRRLAFGPESTFVRRLGLYIATVKAGVSAASDDAVFIYNEPGKAVILHPVRGEALAMFLFRSKAIVDHRDRDAQLKLIRKTYVGAGWQTQDFLRAFEATDDFYFDAVSSVRMDQWTQGRITLLGDAASCVSLFGEGSSSAMTGAAALSEALSKWPDDVPRALAAYETGHRALILPRQRGMQAAGKFIVPATQAGIKVRNLTLRAVGGSHDQPRGDNDGGAAIE